MKKAYLLRSRSQIKNWLSEITQAASTLETSSDSLSACASILQGRNQTTPAESVIIQWENTAKKPADHIIIYSSSASDPMTQSNTRLAERARSYITPSYSRLFGPTDTQTSETSHGIQRVTVLATSPKKFMTIVEIASHGLTQSPAKSNQKNQNSPQCPETLH